VHPNSENNFLQPQYPFHPSSSNPPRAPQANNAIPTFPNPVGPGFPNGRPQPIPIPKPSAKNNSNEQG